MKKVVRNDSLSKSRCVVNLLEEPHHKSLFSGHETFAFWVVAYGRSDCISSCTLRNKALILSSPDQVMAQGLVTVTLKSVDEILRCYHSNETSLMVLSEGTINWF